MQKRRGDSARLTVALALLSAMGIILGKFLAFNVTEFMRFSLENITIIFTGIVFGPLCGMTVGAVQDLVGCIAVGYAINPIITLGSAMIGLISGYMYRFIKKAAPPLKIAVSVALSHLCGSVIIKSIGLTVFYSLPFGVTVLWRILNYIIVGAVEVILLCLLLKSKLLLSQIRKISPVGVNSPLKSMSEATEYTKNVSNVFSKPGLERISHLLKELGNPEKDVKVVHVAGTNGKGSFTAMLSSVLKFSKLRVGCFNSPYLYEMRESIRINGEPISEGELVQLLDRLRPIADSMTDKPTEFELLTAAAYLSFKNNNVDVAIVVCGMGGRSDATNVIDKPLLSVITGIAIDHTSYLGDTVEKIAREKSGIIKHACPVIVGNISDGALAVIKDVAYTLDAPLSIIDTAADVKKQTLGGTLIDCSGIEGIHVPLLGVHQINNAAIVIGAARLLQKSLSNITDESIRIGISRTEWKGRFEVLSQSPLFIFDGAHNLDGIKCAVRSIKTYFDNNVIVISGVLKDKEYEAMADEIVTVADQVITVTPNNQRALPSKEYADVFLARGIKASHCDSIASAVKLAKESSLTDGKAVVCLGSLYLYREVTEAVDTFYKQNSGF